jgi:oligopeptide/dipeptide ABC transporter ATP-binding protein
MSGPESSTVVLDVEDVAQEFRLPRRGGRAVRTVKAVSGVSFQIHEGETVGIVGETGCGKSTLARSIMQIPPPASGRVLLDGKDLTQMNGFELRSARRQLQMVFQDPYSSLDPRWSVAALVAEPLAVHQIGTPRERSERANELLDLVGLDPSRMGARRPRELSGGECQRVGIARALALSPKVVILDEAVSSLDVSIQAQVLNLLERLRAELNLSYLFISHDLSVVRHMSDRVCVMYRGVFCEIASPTELYRHRQHPYSDALISAMPRRDEHHIVGDSVAANVVDPTQESSVGCKYADRCPNAEDICRSEEPQLVEGGPEHWVACHFPLGVAAPGDR